jgi:hypothetical protein
MWYQLGLSQSLLSELPTDQKLEVLKRFCQAYNVPELAEVIDSKVYMFCYDESQNIIPMSYNEYFDGDVGNFISKSYHDWCGSVPYGLDILPDMNAHILIPFWQRAEIKIELPNTPLDGLFCSGVECYLLPQVRENIELMEQTYPFSRVRYTQQEYIEINSSLEQICTIAQNYRMCICWSY